MDLELQGTAAIVGGASSGIGLAVAAALAAEGCAVTAIARGRDRLEDAAERIGPGTLALAGDVRDAGFLQRAVDETVAARGRLDIVVNNAGGPPPGTFDETPDEAWAEAFELSLNAAVRLTRFALPHLRTSGRGRVINIASWSVREPIPHLMLSNAIRPGVV
ncbi:MAG TPA: SDR family NAD(P)-dependent oxidoreductase, partial [Gaiellales bacterium]